MIVLYIIGLVGFAYLYDWLVAPDMARNRWCHIMAVWTEVNCDEDKTFLEQIHTDKWLKVMFNCSCFLEAAVRALIYALRCIVTLAADIIRWAWNEYKGVPQSQAMFLLRQNFSLIFTAMFTVLSALQNDLGIRLLTENGLRWAIRFNAMGIPYIQFKAIRSDPVAWDEDKTAPAIIDVQHEIDSLIDGTQYGGFSTITVDGLYAQGKYLAVDIVYVGNQEVHDYLQNRLSGESEDRHAEPMTDDEI